MILTGTGNGPQTAIAPGTASPMSRVNDGGLFEPPGRFVIDHGGNIYALGPYNGTHVFKIDANDGSSSIVAPSVTLSNPSSLALDPSGNLYIADSGNNVIQKVDAVTGAVSTAVGTGRQGYSGDGGAATSADITGPYSLVFDPAGNLYFIEYPSDYKVHKVDAEIGRASCRERV